MPAGPFVSCFGPLGFWVNRRVLRNEIKDKVEPFDLRKYVLYATCRFREIHRNINTTIAQLPAAGPALEYDQHERISPCGQEGCSRSPLRPSRLPSMAKDNKAQPAAEPSIAHRRMAACNSYRTRATLWRCQRCARSLS